MRDTSLLRGDRQQRHVHRVASCLPAVTFFGQARFIRQHRRSQERRSRWRPRLLAADQAVARIHTGVELLLLPRTFELRTVRQAKYR